MGRAKRPVRAHPGQLYTMSMGAPRDLLLRINGFDEMCDGTGQEDVHLGLRIGQTGAPILYDRSMMIVESDDLNHAGAPLVRHDPWMQEGPLPRAARRIRRAPPPGRRSHRRFAHDGRHRAGHGSWATHGNYYWLADLTPAHYPALVERFPTHHWFDGCPLQDL
jgi:hypothetical protein